MTPKFRHIGIPVNDIETTAIWFGKHGFTLSEHGTDTVNGHTVTWVKLVNDDGFCIELLDGGIFHLAFTVDDVDRSAYFYTAPSGALVQFSFTPDQLPVEYVKPKEE